MAIVELPNKSEKIKWQNLTLLSWLQKFVASFSVDTPKLASYHPFQKFVTIFCCSFNPVFKELLIGVTKITNVSLVNCRPFQRIQRCTVQTQVDSYFSLHAPLHTVEVYLEVSYECFGVIVSVFIFNFYLIGGTGQNYRRNRHGSWHASATQFIHLPVTMK